MGLKTVQSGPFVHGATRQAGTAGIGVVCEGCTLLLLLLFLGVSQHPWE